MSAVGRREPRGLVPLIMEEIQKMTNQNVTIHSITLTIFSRVFVEKENKLVSQTRIFEERVWTFNAHFDDSLYRSEMIAIFKEHVAALIEGGYPYADMSVNVAIDSEFEVDCRTEGFLDQRGAWDTCLLGDNN